MPRCNTCGKPFPDYKELAKHILASRNHRKGKKWAAKYLMINGLSFKSRMSTRINDGREPLTEAQKDARVSTRREISGRMVRVNTICPKCKRRSIDILEQEYTEDTDAWRVKDCFIRLCVGCRKNSCV